MIPAAAKVLKIAKNVVDKMKFHGYNALGVHIQTGRSLYADKFIETV
jgi:hypothetical protein